MGADDKSPLVAHLGQTGIGKRTTAFHRKGDQRRRPRRGKGMTPVGQQQAFTGSHYRRVRVGVIPWRSAAQRRKRRARRSAITETETDEFGPQRLFTPGKTAPPCEGSANFAESPTCSVSPSPRISAIAFQSVCTSGSDCSDDSRRAVVPKHAPAGLKNFSPNHGGL